MTRVLSRKLSELTSLDDASLYLNRELSRLEFNRRVLLQAKDPEMPLLERLRFLCIASTNVDEFFEIRVAGLKEQVALAIDDRGPDGLSPAETLRQVGNLAHELVTEQYGLFQTELIPALAAQHIRILRRADLNVKQRRWLSRYFAASVQPIMTPIALDPSHPFPRLINKMLSVMVRVEGRDAFGRSSNLAIVHAPRSLPRLIALPPKMSDGPSDFVLLSSVVHANIQTLFPGMHIAGCFQFRVTRNSDLWVETEEVDDLLHALKGELPQRNYGDAVRLEVADNCPEDIAEYLLETFSLTEADLYKVNGPVNLYRLSALYDMVDRPDLKFRPFHAGVSKALSRTGSELFAAIRRSDVMLHHPYESFSSVLDFMRAAATDPDVIAIKQTLYRTGAASPFVALLLEAARSGKEVTAIVELRARFDEAANIDLATKLQAHGVMVVYGVVGFKTHAKMIMVVRREGGKLRRYCHLGTGNYHHDTARRYTDVGVLTADRTVGEDVHAIFQQLTGLGRIRLTEVVDHAPFTLHKKLLELIDAETRAAAQGKPSRIIARMNALAEPIIIKALYRASQAGVPIDLIVRGACCLKPGIPGVSETIRVRSIVGRFLEHSRVFYFLQKGNPVVMISSADWMGRNFFSRVETALPIEDERLRERVIDEALTVYLSDNCQAWLMKSDGTYERVVPAEGEPRTSAQETLMQRLGKGAA